MKNLRHFTALALALVFASSAHAQAYGNNSTAVSVSFSSSAPGLSFYTSYTYSSYYVSNLFGHASYSEKLGYSGSYSLYAIGSSYAHPNGSVYSLVAEEKDFYIINSNPYGITVTIDAYTASYSYAAQLGSDDYDYSSGAAQISVEDLQTNQRAVFQSVGELVVADALFGHGNYTASLVQKDGSDFWGGQSYGFGSPFEGSITAYDDEIYTMYFPAYYGAYVIEYVQDRVKSQSHRNATTPAPAAVTPFVIGLLGALRRRKRTN